MVRPEDGVDGSVSMHRGRMEEVVSEVGCTQYCCLSFSRENDVA